MYIRQVLLLLRYDAFLDLQVISMIFMVAILLLLQLAVSTSLMTDTERTEQSVRIMLFSHVMVFYFNFILTPVEGE